MSHIRHIQEEVLTHLEHAQASHKTVANRHRLPYNFQKGDLVWLLRRHVRTTRPCDKLDHQRLGPFRIAAQINDVAFRLDLPSHMRLHPVFHCSLLEPCATTTIPHRIVPPPPVVELVDGPEYEVATILDSKIIRNKLYYLVDWLGYSPNDRTWEPIDNVTNAQALVDAFHRIARILKNPHGTHRFKRGIVS